MIKKKILSKIRKGMKITQKEANMISVPDYMKAKRFRRGILKRRK
jgi:hypothetical protein